MPDSIEAAQAEPRPQVSVFVPAHNEADNVEPLLARIEQGLAARDIRGEVILVDDGSTDGTAERAEALQAQYPWLRVLRHRRNFGLTEAMRTGFRAARGDLVLFLPADLECHPDEDIPKLVDKLNEGYDVVAGWRQNRKGGKVVASSVYNTVSRRLFGLEVHDMNWIKGFRRQVIESLPPLRSDWHRFVLMLAASQGWRVGEVPTQWYPRQAGRSHYGFARIPISFLDVLVVKFLLTFRRHPMRFFGGLGAILVTAAGAIGVYLIYLWVTIGRQQRPVFQFTGYLAVAGLLLFLVGFLAELVVSQSEQIDEMARQLDELRRERSRKP
ncbi:MAG: glycosyltransferase family 2 protein [Anaerolineae bacterium]